ncbi:MAG: uroporphyrinogen-III synthase [Xanthobacteraceae bacterium]
MSDSLAGRRIVVAETRELDLFARMLEQHGAETVRCPMVSIHDVADPAPVEAWLRRFVDQPPDDLILMTGEGLSRLIGFAERGGLGPAFLAGLARVRKITRGPKPAARLRTIGLKPDLAAQAPTTVGVIATLETEDLAGRRVAVQLYPDAPDRSLVEFLAARGANPDPVLCYVYGSKSDDGKVVEVIDAMAGGAVDLIAFTYHHCGRRPGRRPGDRRGRRAGEHRAGGQLSSQADGQRHHRGGRVPRLDGSRLIQVIVRRT